MQIENDYDKEVYNGDIGFVGAIDLELGEVTIAFDGRPVAYAFVTSTRSSSLTRRRSINRKARVIGLFRSSASLEAEILTLHHQLNVLRRKSPKRLAFSNLIVWFLLASIGLCRTL